MRFKAGQMLRLSAVDLLLSSCMWTSFFFGALSTQKTSFPDVLVIRAKMIDLHYAYTDILSKISTPMSLGAKNQL